MIRQPMLAAKSTDSDLKRLQYPLLVSPKIDGIRGVVVNGQLMSRSMKPIRNTWTQRKFGRLEFEGFDGELVVGNPWDKSLMQQTSSGVMSISGTPDVRFFVFDRWNDPRGYHSRYESLMGMQNLEAYGVTVLRHLVAESFDDLLRHESHWLSCGYEGLMIRSLTGRYKDGRSTLREGGLIKVKRFTDGEAIITGSSPLMRNDNELESDERGYAKRSHSAAGKVADDLLGTLHVVGVGSAVSFSIGSGFTESQRRALWDRRADLVGKVVKYKHFAVTGVKDAPRMPIFIGFRDPEDM